MDFLSSKTSLYIQENEEEKKEKKEGKGKKKQRERMTGLFFFFFQIFSRAACDYSYSSKDLYRLSQPGNMSFMNKRSAKMTRSPDLYRTTPQKPSRRSTFHRTMDGYDWSMTERSSLRVLEAYQEEAFKWSLVTFMEFRDVCDLG